MKSNVKVAPSEDLASPSKLKDKKDSNDLVTPINIRENQTMPDTQTVPKETPDINQESAKIEAE